jgi:hypothetical protein
VSDPAGRNHRGPLSAGAAFAAYVALDVVAAGMGMGVPIFCILLGFPAGWYAMRVAAARLERERGPADVPPPGGVSVALLRQVSVYALVASGVTLFGMAVLWGAWGLAVLFDPATDYGRLGMPLLLFEPKASFIGWLVLMIVVSPVLQLLAMVFGSHVALLVGKRAARE